MFHFCNPINIAKTEKHSNKCKYFFTVLIIFCFLARGGGIRIPVFLKVGFCINPNWNINAQENTYTCNLPKNHVRSKCDTEKNLNRYTRVANNFRKLVHNVKFIATHVFGDKDF